MWSRLDGTQRTLAATVGVVVVMAGMGWAAVPLYDLFCRVTGYGGTTGVAAAGPETVSDHTVTIRFDASLERDMPWQFRPAQRTMEVRLGETGLAFYEAHNPTDEVVAGTASYNVAPFGAGRHFAKIDCFCFTMQVLEPGETVQMPVSFYVDPAILDDPDAGSSKQITLSYTFHTTDLPEDYAGLAAQDSAETLQ